MRIPPGYKSLDATPGHPKVMKLKKSLYGLRRSPRNWFNTIDDSLRDIGFTATASDPCVYIFGSDNSLSVLTMYVDDLLLLGGNTPLLKDLRTQLMDRFAMTDMGDVSMVPGIQITRDREAKTLTISQEHYAKSVLARFGMAECSSVHTTGAGAEVIPQATGHDASRLYGHPTLPGYHGVPDAPGSMHALRYHLRRQPTGPSHERTIKTTHDGSKASSPLPNGRYGPSNHVQDRVFRNDEALRCELGNNPVNGKSTSGYLFMLAGGPLSFKTALQNVTAQSTLEAELISMEHASKGAVYLSNMTAELGFRKLFESAPLFGDNTGAVVRRLDSKENVKHV